MVSVFEPEEFETPEESKIIEELDVEGTAKRNGQRGLPFDTDTAPDSTELNIRGAVETKIHQASLMAQKSYDAIASTIESITIDGEAADLKSLPESFQKEAAVEFASFQEEFVNAKSEVTRFEHDYDRFRKVNQLKHEASYPESKTLFISTLIFVLICESLANAYFFAMGNDYGLLGGALQAFLVSVVNVGLGLVVGGILFRQVNHVEKWRKYLFGTLCFVVWSAAFLWNLLVGHYRTALSLEPDNAESLAIQRFLESPLNLGELASWMLFAIGILIFIFVNYKAYHGDDPYPGYSKVDRRLNDAKSYKTELVAEWHERMEALHSKYTADLDDLFHICKDRADRLERSHRSIQRQISILDRYVASYNQVFESCIRTYRQVNRQNRDAPCPSYFETFTPVVFKHDFHPDAVLDKREHIKARRDEIASELPKIKNGLMQTYKNMVEGLR